MRIALLSDIHGNLAALESVHRDVRRRGVDAVVVLGDNVSGPLMPQETAEYLISEGWLTISGNHDRHVTQPSTSPLEASDLYAISQLGQDQIHWLASLDSCHQYSEEVFLCHGTPESDCTYFLESIRDGRLVLATASEVQNRLGGQTSAVVACGHTHVPRVARSNAGQLLVNPGSVGLQAYRDADHQPHAVEMGSTDARYAIIESSPEGWLAHLLAVPYSHKQMANLARNNGRADWEVALLSGYAL